MGTRLSMDSMRSSAVSSTRIINELIIGGNRVSPQEVITGAAELPKSGEEERNEQL